MEMSTKTEQVYQEIMNQFKRDITESIGDAHSKIYGEMLPFVTNDTEFNAAYRASELVSKLLIGEFKFDGKALSVDGHVIGRINDFNYNKLVDVIASVAGDAAKDAKIARLEATIREYALLGRL